MGWPNPTAKPSPENEELDAPVASICEAPDFRGAHEREFILRYDSLYKVCVRLTCTLFGLRCGFQVVDRQAISRLYGRCLAPPLRLSPSHDFVSSSERCVHASSHSQRVHALCTPRGNTIRGAVGRKQPRFSRNPLFHSVLVSRVRRTGESPSSLTTRWPLSLVARAERYSA